MHLILLLSNELSFAVGKVVSRAFEVRPVAVTQEHPGLFAPAGGLGPKDCLDFMPERKGLYGVRGQSQLA